MKRLQDASVLPAVLALAAPVVVQSILQVFIGTVDLKKVGSLGSGAIAAVGLGRQVIMIIMIFVMAISTGVTALVASNVGRGDQRAAARSAGDSFTLVLIFAPGHDSCGIAFGQTGIGAGIMGFFGLASFIFAPWLLAFFTDDPEMIAVGVVPGSVEGQEACVPDPYPIPWLMGIDLIYDYFGPKQKPLKVLKSTVIGFLLLL